MNFLTIAVCKKEQGAGHLPTCTTVSNIAGISSIMILREKVLQKKKKKEASHRIRIIFENLGMSLLHPWLHRQAQVKKFSKATKL